MLNPCKILLCLVVLLPLNATLKEASGHYAKISEEVSLFYHDVGIGEPLVFIPGWLMPSEVFKAQIAYFSQKYRVIALDPRSQGHSSVTLENNNYTQHGADLAKFLDQLHLHNVIVVAWSWGCNDLYAYVRLKGSENLKAAICIDASPKSSGGKGQWAFADYQDWGSAVVQPMMYNRASYAKEWAQSMIERPLSSQELNWFINESFKTPTYAALEMAVDAIYADYQPEARLLESKNIPTLDFVSERFADVAKKWLQVNSPHTQLQIMGEKHLAFWEHPDRFNKLLERFLEDVLKNKLVD